MRPASAFALGLLHGPAELLPVSSSAHAGLFLHDLPPDRRKELEVALHTGTLAVLGLPRPSAWLVAATVPPALAGLLLERQIEERLGPRSTAVGLVAGGLAMTLADELGKGPGPDTKFGEGPGPSPKMGVFVGVAQAFALIPGVSRHGAALTALRALGFSRPRAHELSREAAKPVLLGATVLKAFRVRDGFAALGAAALGSAISTHVARKALAGRGVRAPLWPFALYRAALAASVWRHGRS